MTGEGTLEFRLLGPLEARLENRTLPLGGRRQRGLLALLLLRANEVVSRDRLVDELWRDHAPETAANALAALVSRLRRVLPANVLVTRSGGYEASVELDAIDVFRFQRLADEGGRALASGDAAEAADRLRSGLALWRGPPLADFTYEPFAEPVIRRLTEIRLAAVENRIDADLALGRHGELAGELQSLVQDHPLRERFRGQLMLALYRSGRQAEALEVYRDGRQALLDELGIDPSPALQELERAILRQDPGVRAPRSAPTTELASPPTAHTVADEVRPVTILHADVVGTRALSERLAANEALALVHECLTIISRAVEEFGGIVQAYEGDAIWAYFGVPTAYGNDPERAARSALRILELVDRYARDIESAWGITGFAVRVGINGGRAAVGSVGGAELQAVALGDATDVAVGLQAAAAPGTILVGETTARRLAPRFALEPHGEIAVKGREVAVSRLIVASPREPASSPPASVGREREIDASEAVVADVVSGRGRIVLVTGAAGHRQDASSYGTSFTRWAAVTWLEGHCLSYGGLAVWPFIEMLYGWLAAEIGEPEIAVRTKARARLGALLGEVSKRCWHRSGPCSASDAEPAIEAASPTSPGAYLSWLEALAAEQPVVVALEDVQWADVLTRGLAEGCHGADRSRRRGACAYRRTDRTARRAPSLRLARGRQLRAPHNRDLALGPLAEEASEELLAVSSATTSNRPSAHGLVREAEGNPLYLEELARALSGRRARVSRPYLDDLDAVARAAAPDPREPSDRADRPSGGRPSHARTD